MLETTGTYGNGSARNCAAFANCMSQALAPATPLRQLLVLSRDSSRKPRSPRSALPSLANLSRKTPCVLLHTPHLTCAAASQSRMFKIFPLTDLPYLNA